MSLPRFLQAIRTRWWVVVAIAAVGAGSAFVAALIRNSGLEPVYEGVAPISVIRLDGEEDSQYTGRLESAQTEAEAAVVPRLVDDTLSVTSDPDQGVVRFVAIAASPDEALDAATNLRASYLDSIPSNTAEDQLAPVLEALATEIVLVQNGLAEINAARTDQVVELQRQTLTSELETATQELVVAQTRLLNPGLTLEQRTGLETQEATAEETIAGVGALLEALPASSDPVADAQARLETLVLQRRLRDLESRYISVALRRSAGGTEGLVGVPSVVDRSGAPVSPLLAALVGAVVGTLLGSIAVVGTDRIRDPVRTVEDVPGLTAIRVSRRPRKLAGSVGWYQTARGNARRLDIQALRARIDRLMGPGKVVLIAGVDSSARDVIDVAVDLASAVAVTGRSVVLVDTRLGEALAGPWENAGSSLAEILSAPEGGAPPDRSEIKRSIWDRTEVAPNLMVIPAGSLDEDPVDALAGLSFTAVVEEARDLVDLVLLVTGDVTDPMSEAVAGRARLAVLTAQKDRTRKKDLLAGAASLEQLGVSVAAVALLVGLSPASRSRKGAKSIPQTSLTTIDSSARHLG